jgi:hypothetical protein
LYAKLSTKEENPSYRARAVANVMIAIFGDFWRFSPFSAILGQFSATKLAFLLKTNATTNF